MGDRGAAMEILETNSEAPVWELESTALNTEYAVRTETEKPALVATATKKLTASAHNLALETIT
jgi:hypothetical protein